MSYNHNTLKIILNGKLVPLSSVRATTPNEKGATLRSRPGGFSPCFNSGIPRPQHLDNLSNYSKPCIQVEPFNNHHLDIHISTIKYGDEYPNTSNDIFSFSEGLDLWGINSKYASHSLQYSFMGCDTLSIHNGFEKFSINVSSYIKFE